MSTPTRLDRPIRTTRERPAVLSRLVTALVAVYVALAAVMIATPAVTEEAVLAAHPGIAPPDLDIGVTFTIVASTALHAVHSVIVIWLVAKASRRRRWARLTLTAYLPVAVVASFLSMSTSAFIWAVLVANLIQVALVAVLWIPRWTREFFAPVSQIPAAG